MERADVVVVGSGASGAAAAWALSRRPGLRVLCLEQGERTDPAQYPATQIGWELRRQGDASFDPNIRHARGDYPIDNAASPISLANFNGLGGGTILYSAHFPRFHPSDFRTRSLDGVGDDWPLSYDQLEPFFTQNEQMMGVAGLVGDPAYPEYQSLLPPVPLGPMGRKLAEGFNALGWHWWPSYAAINTRHHDGRAACANLGPCNTGCAQGAKGSVDVTYWPHALNQGVELRTGCSVQQVLMGDDGRVRGLRYVDAQGASHDIDAGFVVLAAGGAGTPRLLLNSATPRHPNGLANDSGLVGRNLMVHPLAYVEAVFDQDLRSSIGPHGCCLLSQHFYESDSSRGFQRGYTMHILRGAPPLETALGGLMSRRIPLGGGHHRAMAATFNRSAGIAVISEDLPDPANRIELDPDHRDRFGMPGIKVTYALGDNTKAMLTHGIEQSRKVLEAAGGKVTMAFSPVRHSGWHVLGTTRMGDDPAISVVDRFGRAHGIDNLYVVDSSLFVTAGAVNPVATAQALTLYCCDHLAKRLGPSP